MVLAAYFDAGGHETNQEFLVVAGFVATGDMWSDFDRLWRERLAEDGIEYFHAVEFAQSVKQFRGWKDQEPRRRALSSDLMDILRRHVSRKFVSVVENKVLTDNMSKETKERYHINAYALAGRTCAARLREWLVRDGWRTVPELIFEEGDIGRGKLTDSLVRDGFATPIFKPKRDKVTADGLTIIGPAPLQAADWLAYEMLIATKRGKIERWAMKEFVEIVGSMGIHAARDITAMEALLTTPVDVIMAPGYWGEIFKVG